MILIVDDDDDLAETCAMMLRAFDYQVEVAIGCKSALKIMALRAPRLLLSDCYMPGMTGQQLCEYLHQVYPVVPFPILLMSGSPERHVAPLAAYSGFLRKPFLAEHLLREVARLIGPPRNESAEAVR